MPPSPAPEMPAVTTPRPKQLDMNLGTTAPAAFVATAPAPNPTIDVAAPIAASTPTWPQLTSPYWDFCVAIDIPADTRAPDAAINASPANPPIPVNMSNTPAATAAAATRYSQF